MTDCEILYKWAKGLKTIYQPLKGFEEKTDPVRVEGFKKILQTIVDHCGVVEGKRFLDIGANVGYFCFQLTDMGAETIALERDVRRSQLSKCVAKKMNYSEDNPRFMNWDAPTWILAEKPQVDYVILLNTFHHILVQDEAKAWRMFNWLIENTDGIFIMMRNALKGWRLCDSTVGIPEAVLEQSSAENYVEYPAVHGRKIYFFSK
jgi:hypothetical protein